MAKGNTQWEFTELFVAQQRRAAEEARVAAEPARKIETVSQLTGRIRQSLEDQIGMVWVTGEITNFRFQGSGHIYFTLKDAATQIGCVLFKGERKIDRSLLEDGRKVILQGQLTVYEPRGQYQLRVVAVELEGVGALQAAFEKLKQKLNAEGLFAPERKRPLPRFAQRVGVVTSPNAAALLDVLHVAGRRNPALRFLLAPCRVQGPGAAEEIAAGIRMLNYYHQEQRIKGSLDTLDLILVTRGGGSLEDLWAFNEEVVARAIFESELPVVSAVGHEIDFTISDFVADLRAATPSAAAELITAGVVSSCEYLAGCSDYLNQLVRRAVQEKCQELAQWNHRLTRCHPQRRLEDSAQRIDEMLARISRCTRQHLRQGQVEWRNNASRLVRLRPSFVLKQQKEVLGLSEQRLQEVMRHLLGAANSRLNAATARLKLLGPEQVLARGYSITMDSATGKVLRRQAEVKPGMKLRTRLHQGEILSDACASD